MPYEMNWNLDSIFLGGSKSNQFLNHLNELEVHIHNFKRSVASFNAPPATGEGANIAELVSKIGETRIHLSQANSFVTCLLSQNPKDQDAATLRGKILKLESDFKNELSKVKVVLANTKQEIWVSLIEAKELADYKFILNEWRENTHIHLSEDEQSIIADLMVDGYHSWGHFYNALVSSMTVNIEVDGNENQLSIGQAINLRSNPDEKVRNEAHQALEALYEEKEELFAKILNHIAGFRLQIYQYSRIENVLEIPLKENRITENTMNAMWSVVEQYKKPFSNYLKRKAEFTGNPTMKAYNFWAPITNKSTKIHYDDAVVLITTHFSQFGNELEAFAKHAFNEGWIEAEDRANKSAFPFCASFPLTGESRIFMTFGGTFLNVLTLVHELGHAFHNYAMKSVDGLNKQYPMSIAETASTFAEMIIFDAALEKAQSTEEKLLILDEKLKRSVMNFMNIHSRFLFEQRFYEERKKGLVSAKRLNQLMNEAIQEAYNGSLEEPSTYSWVWTPHYYITHSPFYNFPYTFGYLLALGIFAKAKEKGKEFEKDYLNLLRDSGSMTVEDLVMKHLGEDITSKDFWVKGMEICVKDAEEFITLTCLD
ncbi:pepF/M3 family oligoendopeptidase [Solibacillus kalamii]|uniref:Pantothenate kinase n=1 Tax=Solibacillus kalamii TaxID=1748298 RepID=A0ABX3ZK79_9BACL|nr:M3 family oligoendopeptidase [Solibacillus kalamii]MBM7664086.1 pepF/M3 family oligoendopeptidase [Solibacillus kalamii]OUZ40142.1 pantothenate kinase [Solibacillus kalamii]